MVNNAFIKLCDKSSVEERGRRRRKTEGKVICRDLKVYPIVCWEFYIINRTQADELATIPDPRVLHHIQQRWQQRGS